MKFYRLHIERMADDNSGRIVWTYGIMTPSVERALAFIEQHQNEIIYLEVL